MNRYPGIRPFTAEDQHLFKGRKQEQRDLSQLVVLNNLVVLFGKSGIGKSSLLQAGIGQNLEERGLHNVFFRFNNTKLPPQEQVYQKLKDEEYLPSDMPSGLNLWEYFKKFWYVDAGEVMTPVFIFDQFEELFTLYPWEERHNFIQQLADVVNGRMPGDLRERLRKETQDNLQSENVAEEDWTSPPNVKIILSIRSDFLYLLDELSSEIPSILRCRFQLKALDRKNAIEAMTLPAALSGNYASPPFSFDQQALDNIIASLGKEQKGQLSASQQSPELEIEAFQLQLLCQKIEEKIIAENKEKGFVVTPDFYGGAAGVEEIISSFYENTIAKLPKEAQLQAGKLLGKGLVRNRRRIIMEESAIIDEYGLGKPALDILQKERLLKREARKGQLYYEISHDTLLAPIIERYRVIEKEEQDIAIEKELAEERRKRRKALQIALVGFGLFVATAIFLAIAVRQSKLLKEKNIEIANEAYRANLQLAKALKTEGEYEQSLLKLDALLPISKELKPPKVTEVEGLMTTWAQVKSYMETGDSLKAIGKLKPAILQYNKADSVDHDNTIENIILETSNILDRYNELMNRGDIRAASLENKRLAIQAYQAALKLKPNDPAAIAKLKKLGVKF